jgi:hypothetical protein
LAFGWKVVDILLVTSFPYEYRGVRSYIVDLDCYYPYYNRATKILAINRLFEKGAIDDTTWFHDFDTFQLAPMPEIATDFGVMMYRHKNRQKWNAGSFFFRNAHDAFTAIENRMWRDRIDEEDALAGLMNEGGLNPEILDLRYNIHIYDFEENCRKAEKPILVAHFHPSKPRHMRLFSGLIPESLKAIFESHGIDTLSAPA